MTTIVLDSAPVGLLTKPVRSTEVVEINYWLESCAIAGSRVILPEIIDYEIRRELLRANKAAGIARLDHLKANVEYLPLTTAAMLLAADLWAQTRRAGLPTSDPKGLYIDVILAAQALTLGLAAADFIVATTNVAHLTRFVPADLWSNVVP